MAPTPPGSVKISHKKDDHRRRPHRFHVSWSPLPGRWICYCLKNQNFLDFIQFFGKFGTIVSWRSFFSILDPPLHVLNPTQRISNRIHVIRLSLEHWPNFLVVKFKRCNHLKKRVIKERPCHVCISYYTVADPGFPRGSLSYYYLPQTKFAKVMFSQVSVCPQGAMHRGGVRGRGDMHGGEGGMVCMEGGMHGMRDGSCSGRYAFYWNAFLFGLIFAANCMKMKKKLDWDALPRSVTAMVICLIVLL